jgi:hypothetical protein
MLPNAIGRYPVIDPARLGRMLVVEDIDADAIIKTHNRVSGSPTCNTGSSSSELSPNLGDGWASRAELIAIGRQTPALWRSHLYARADEGAVRSVTKAARCRTLVRKYGPDSSGSAKGDEEDFIIVTLNGARGRIADRADDPSRGRHSGRPCRSRGAGRSGLAPFTRRSRITFLGWLPASHQ